MHFMNNSINSISKKVPLKFLLMKPEMSKLMMVKQVILMPNLSSKMLMASKSIPKPL
jgi:hypothetical protein